MKKTRVFGWVAALSAAAALTGSAAPAKGRVASDYERAMAMTNFSGSAGALYGAFSREIAAVVRTNDLVRFGRLVDALAREPDVLASCGGKQRVFDLWASAAESLVQAALRQRKLKPAERSEDVVAGFRSGGTTFGFWSVDTPISAETLDSALVGAACNVLERKMPQMDGNVELRYLRDSKLMSIQNRVGTEKGKTAAFARIRDFALNARPDTPGAHSSVSNAVEEAYRFYFGRRKWYDAAAYLGEMIPRRTDFYGAQGIRLWRARRLAMLSAAGLEGEYLKGVAAFHREPLDATGIAALEAFAADAGWRLVPEVAAPYFAAIGKTFAGNERMRLDVLKFHVARETADLPALKAAYADMKAVHAADTNTVNYAARCRAAYVSHLGFTWEDYAAQLPELKLAVSPRNPQSYWDLAVCQRRLGDVAGALESVNVYLGAMTKPSYSRLEGLMFKAILEAKDPDDLVRRLESLHGEVDKVYGSYRKDPTPDYLEECYFGFVRRAGKFLYELDSSREQIRWVRAVTAYSETLIHGEEPVVYTATYVKDAPTSADGALRSGLFSQLKVENRLGLYGVYDNFHRKRDLARLKGKPAPHLAADEPGKEAAVVCCYDDGGLHVYVKLNDPDARRSRFGVANRADLEYVVMGGEEGSWHWNAISALDPRANMEVDWDSPRKGFKLGEDCIVTDGTSSDTCHVFHIYVPWLTFYEKLPRPGGESWRVALIAAWAGKFGALGGGIVHELGRAMKVVFELTPESERAIRRGLLMEAVGDYRKVRNAWENVCFWEDPHMGDPDFYYRTVEPRILELDQFAKEVEAGALDDAAVERALAERLEELANFRLAVDALRCDELEKGFFPKR